MRNAAVALVLLAACSNPAPGTAPKTPSAASTAAAKGATPQPPAPPLTAKALLENEAKIVAYLTYQKEMAPYVGLAVGMAAGAYNRGAKDGKSMGDAMKKDDRLAEFNKANEAALAKSGLTTAEHSAMAMALTSYVSKVYVARDFEKNSASPNAPGYIKLAAEKQGAELKQARDDFAKQYGQQALDNVTKHETEFVAVQEATMNAVLSKK